MPKSSSLDTEISDSLGSVIQLRQRLIGSYYAVWISDETSAERSERDARSATLRKLHATCGQKIVVTVYSIDANGPHIRYACRVPGFRGFFGLHQFLWFGSASETAQDSALPPDYLTNIQEERKEIKRIAQNKYNREKRKRKALLLGGHSTIPDKPLKGV